MAGGTMGTNEDQFVFIRVHLCASVLKVFVVASLSTASFAAEPARPLVPLLTAEEIPARCDAGLAKARAMIAEMEAKPGGEGPFDDWNRLQIAIQDTGNPIQFLANVHPEKAVRDAAEACAQKYARLGTELLQDEKLLARVRDAKPATPVQAKLRRDVLDAFEDSGVALAPGKRARAREIFERLTGLRQEFARNLRDDATKVVFTPAEMEGLPEAYLQAQKRDTEGNYVLGVDYPTYNPFMSNAKDEEARRRYYIAYQRRGGERNLELLEEMYRLRRELAALHGLPTFADYGLRRKMAAKPAAVEAFLDQVHKAVAAKELAEMEELRAEKARLLGTPLEATRLHYWDVAYYQEGLRRLRFAIDQESLRRYFPTRAAIDYALLVSQTLYGVKFEEAKVPAWHPDVRYFDVRDAKSGELLSGFYLDLFPRPGKFTHAAAFTVRGASRLAARTPLSALVTNFNRDGLNQNELRTLLHEFGHVLHGVLSRTDYVSQSGTSVKRDFVEAPSQMFEAWARREQALALFAKVCPTCPQLSGDDIARLEAARRFGLGYRYGQQVAYARLDMALSTRPEPPLDAWKRIEGEAPLGFVEGSLFPAAFDHLAGGYAAGYYGYLWSEVLAFDLLSAFRKDMLDPAVGRRYRDTILSQGAQQEEMAMVEAFLGRPPSNVAFFEDLR
jgi:Zn-dependent oligopeptidase